MLDGRTFEQVRKFTLRQAEILLKEQAEEFKNQARLQGAEFEDEESTTHEATSSDIAALMSFCGKK